MTLGLDQLTAMIADGSIDTVLVAFADNQGRLVGKRVMGQYFLDVVAHGSIEACNYLLAVDVEMTPLPGYETFNWDQGYGDFSAVPDL
ncbi:MAG: glutamine synthetase, partial [Acidimicrobiales bacterium]